MNEFDIHDTIVDPVSYQDLVLMAQNINPASGRTLRDELRALLKNICEDAMELYDAHAEEIYAAAFPDEHKELRLHPKWSETGCELLAKEIQQWLCKNELWMDVSIYYNGKRMSTHGEVDGQSVSRYNGEPFLEEDKDPRDYFEYVANPHVLSMSFEGPLYEVLNGYCVGSGRLEKEFSDLLRRWGLYYELGDAWNLTVAEV